jgi:hypothetical protein
MFTKQNKKASSKKMSQSQMKLFMSMGSSKQPNKNDRSKQSFGKRSKEVGSQF